LKLSRIFHRWVDSRFVMKVCVVSCSLSSLCSTVVAFLQANLSVMSFFDIEGFIDYNVSNRENKLVVLMLAKGSERLYDSVRVVLAFVSFVSHY
jgi:hypothetical protein